MFTTDSTVLSKDITSIFTSLSSTLGHVFSDGFNTIIKRLFSNNEVGFFYDPSDLSTLYQDAAGTIPVTAAGQPVGLMKDKSGRNNHASQTVSASRPILQRNATTGASYLAFDGVDDFLQTNNIDFTSTDKVSLFAGIRKLSDSVFGAVVETGTSYYTPSGGFALFAPFDSKPTFGFGVSGGSTFYNQMFSDYTSPRSSVTSLCLDLSATDRQTQVKFNIDGVGKVIGVGSVVKGNFANTPIFIGRRGGKTLPFNGHVYSLVGIGKLTTDNESVAIEKEFAKRLGVTLNV